MKLACVNPCCTASLRQLSTTTCSRIKLQLNDVEQQSYRRTSTSRKASLEKKAARESGKKERGRVDTHIGSALLKRRRTLDLKFNAQTAERLLLYKDEDIIAINKPAGLAVHGGPGLLNDLSRHLYLWEYGGDTPHLAHRLDKDVSGVLLLTRHTASARRIARAFHDQKLVKKYWAMTVGVPDRLEGSVDIPLGIRNIASRGRQHSMNRVVLREDFAGGARKTDLLLPSGVNTAVTRYKVLSVCSVAHKRCCLMEVQPITGIKHQVRVHLADGLMCPILGDHKFGGRLFRASSVLKKKVKLMDCVEGFMYLHAHTIEIPGYQGKGKSLVIKAPPPSHFVQSSSMLGLQLLR